MKKIIFALITGICTFCSNAQEFDPKLSEVWEPVPRKVNPGNVNTAPDDAIVLFDGTNLDAWLSSNEEGPARWKITDNHITVVPGTGGISTKQSFGDIQLHIEWRSPAEIRGEDQNRGNSGIFLQGRYEVQVLDSYQNTTYPNGQAGSIYKQYMPLVNACRPPGEWQTYDIIYSAPRFNEDGIRIKPGYITVIHNGVLIQNHVPIKGTTEFRRIPRNIAHGDAPIMLQDHNCEVSFRNIWVREL